MATMSEHPLRAIPSVERLVREAETRPALARYRRDRMVEAARTVLAESRVRVSAGSAPPAIAALLDAVAARLEIPAQGVRARVINATGVGLHTNLGRAQLPEAAIEAIVQAARHPSALELDLARGQRGDRDAVVRDDLCRLTGAEDALVVNNNAAAVLLALTTIASGREAVVSRGELVEIGGSFRMPDVMAVSGARLREVGTTNRTHADDYRRAIGPETGVLLKVHPSNFRMLGFTASVSLTELAAIGRAAGVPVVDDLGSGALVDLTAFGLPREPVVRERVAAGADLVTFSGDKLLGGPQAGIVVGRQKLVRRLAAHPLRRALRPDKLTLAALAATLEIYRDAPDPTLMLPTLRWLTRPLVDLDAVGRLVAPLLEAKLGEGHHVRLVQSEAEVGSGAVPARSIESRALAVEHPMHTADAIAGRFRRGAPPVLGRIHEGRFLLDLRGVHRAEDLIPEQL